MKYIFLFAVLLLSFMSAAQAADISVSGAWTRPVVIEGRPGAAYFTLHNGGKVADRLLSASSVGAARVEIHEHQHDNGIMRMRKVDGVDIAPGAEVDFAPGGYHLMIFGLKEMLPKGAKLEIELEFEKAGRMKIRAVVANSPHRQPLKGTSSHPTQL